MAKISDFVIPFGQPRFFASIGIFDDGFSFSLLVVVNSGVTESVSVVIDSGVRESVNVEIESLFWTFIVKLSAFFSLDLL